MYRHRPYFLCTSSTLGIPLISTIYAHRLIWGMNICVSRGGSPAQSVIGQCFCFQPPLGVKTKLTTAMVRRTRIRASGLWYKYNHGTDTKYISPRQSASLPN